MSKRLSVSVIIQPFKWIFRLFWSHRRMLWLLGWIGAKGPPEFKAWGCSLVVRRVRYWKGWVRGDWTHTSAPPPSYFLLSQACATFMPLISSVWVLQRKKKSSHFPVSFRGNWRWDISIILTLGQGRASRNAVECARKRGSLASLSLLSPQKWARGIHSKWGYRELYSSDAGDRGALPNVA